jgi:RNase P/RNase MRP subunit p30
MKFDIILNKKLEQTANKFGFSKFIYAEKFEKVRKMNADIIILDEKNYSKTHQIILNLSKQNKTIIIAAKDNEYNKKALENSKVSGIVNIEYIEKKDRLYQRNSGLNHVLCRLASKNKKIVYINISRLNFLEKKVRAIILGRIMQNIKLCRKYKTKVAFATFAKNEEELRNRYDLEALGLSLGMSTQQLVS